MITGDLEKEGLWFFAKNPGINPRIASPDSLKVSDSKESAWSSDLRWAVAKATRRQFGALNVLGLSEAEVHMVPSYEPATQQINPTWG